VTPTDSRSSAGFTLVEVLAVLAILGLLMSLAVFSFGKQQERARETQTTAVITQLEGLIATYMDKRGGPPPDSLAALNIRSDNDANEGAEALYAALHHKDYREGASLAEDALGNCDDDSTPTSYHRDGSSFLLEAVDGWDNPIAYFSPASYGKQARYLLGDPKDPDDPEQVVTAQKSDVTGAGARPDPAQLTTAGAARTLGPAYAVTNFTR
jgi:prepilin-type N-terminal cleavage/methylation domain-containing protein